MTVFGFVYSSHKTKAAAMAALESYYATGEVSEGEVAGVVKRGKRWRIILHY